MRRAPRNGFAQTTGPTSRRATRQRFEDILQKSIVEWHSVGVIDPRSAILFAVPNGEKRDAVTAAILSGISADDREKLPEADKLRPFGLGLLPGVVDLILLTDGPCTDLIEVKRGLDPLAALLPKKDQRRPGKLDAQQVRFRDATVKLRHNHWVFSTIEQYAELLELRRIRVRFRPWGPGIAAPLAQPQISSAK
jgi:hypothetical protein